MSTVEWTDAERMPDRPNPEPLARALCRYDGHDHDQCSTVDFRREALHRQVERILADPGPLLAALAEAGVLWEEWCVAAPLRRSTPRTHPSPFRLESNEHEERRYVTEWRPTDV